VKNNLELKLACDRQGKTINVYQYSAQPLGISRSFYPDVDNRQRAHLYITSTSPGLLAEDRLKISLQLMAGSQLYLSEQSATKVHPMPIPNSKATLDYDIAIDTGAILEFVPEPLILFHNATFGQTTLIKCHPQGSLFWSEIIVPGRIARGEFYDFYTYSNRLQVTSLTGELWFTDALVLEGKDNPFKNAALFASAPILGTGIIISPQTDLNLLSDRLEALDRTNCSGVRVATTILPYNKGLLIRAIAQGTHGLKNYLTYARQCFRQK